MACLMTSGIGKGCRDNIGGINSVFLCNIELLSSVTYATSLVSEISTQTTLGAIGASFYTFQVNKNSSNWTDNGAAVASNGGTFYSPTVVMIFGKNEASKANTVKLMGQSTLVAIVKNNDGKYFLLGVENGLEVSSAVFASGTANADLNGWTITISGGEIEPALEIPAALMTSAILV